VVDALDGVGGDAQAHVLAERIRDEGDVAQVRQEPALGLDVGVAHPVAHLRALGGQFTASRHLAKSSAIPACCPRLGCGSGVQNQVHPGNGGRIGGEGRKVKVLGGFSLAPPLRKGFAVVLRCETSGALAPLGEPRRTDGTGAVVLRGPRCARPPTGEHNRVRRGDDG
jgi:hypothetical protein